MLTRLPDDPRRPPLATKGLAATEAPFGPACQAEDPAQRTVHHVAMDTLVHARYIDGQERTCYLVIAERAGIDGQMVTKVSGRDRHR